MRQINDITQNLIKNGLVGSFLALTPEVYQGGTKTPFKCRLTSNPTQSNLKVEHAPHSKVAGHKPVKTACNKVLLKIK